MSLFSRMRDALAPKGPEPFDGGVVAPATGELGELGSCSDAVFASGAMGPGFVVRPAAGSVVSPVPGTVSVAYETGHAFGITTADGVEVLVHVGVDTVELGGAPFKVRVRQGDVVGAGDELVSADLGAIEAAGKSPETMVLFPEAAGRALSLERRGGVVAGERVATLS